jgi:hypothetical protein
MTRTTSTLSGSQRPGGSGRCARSTAPLLEQSGATGLNLTERERSVSDVYLADDSPHEGDASVDPREGRPTIRWPT